MVKNNMKESFRFTALMSSLARAADLTKCLFLNDKPWLHLLLLI